MILDLVSNAAMLILYGLAGVVFIGCLLACGLATLAGWNLLTDALRPRPKPPEPRGPDPYAGLPHVLYIRLVCDPAPVGPSKYEVLAKQKGRTR